jgi:hypothetical protein
VTKDFYAPYKATSYLKDTGYSIADVWGLMKKEPEYYYYAQKYLNGEDLF